MDTNTLRVWIRITRVYNILREKMTSDSGERDGRRGGGAGTRRAGGGWVEYFHWLIFQSHGKYRGHFLPRRSFPTPEVISYPRGHFLPRRSFPTPEVISYPGGHFLPRRSFPTPEVISYPSYIINPLMSTHVPFKSVSSGDSSLVCK